MFLKKEKEKTKKRESKRERERKYSLLKPIPYLNNFCKNISDFQYYVILLEISISNT